MLVEIGVLSLLMFFTLADEGCTSNKMHKRDNITSISFSPDGKKMLFNRHKDDVPGMIHVYNLETGELSAYDSGAGELWSSARYSNDGKKIVFISIPYNPDGFTLNIKGAQIAIMGPDGKNVKKITSSPGYKRAPSFSYSGKKIIFVRSEVTWQKGSRANAGRDDVYEFDMVTGRETSTM